MGDESGEVAPIAAERVEIEPVVAEVIERAPVEIDLLDAGAETGELVVAEQAGMVLLQGPQDVVERFVSSDPLLSTVTPHQPKGPGAAGALSALSGLSALTALQGMAHAPVLFQLDAAGLAMFREGALASAAGGGDWLRLFGHGAQGITGHGALKPVSMAPMQAMTAQLALTTLALTAAIKDVQEAVERVEDKVDVIRDLLESERIGVIIGAHRSLSRRAEQVDFTGSLTDTDWHAIDDIGIEIEQQIEGLRSFVRKRLAAAEEARERIDGRVDAIELIHQLTETLGLLIVAQDSLFLYQQLRLTRIRDTQVDRLPDAQQEAVDLLERHRVEDQELLRRARDAVAERASVDPLEIHRFLSVRSLVETVADVDDQLAWFARERSLLHAEIGPVAAPGIKDAATAVKERGGALFQETKCLAERTWGRVRSGAPELDAGDVAPALEPGRGTPALEPGGEETQETDPKADAGAGAAAAEDAGHTARVKRGARHLLAKARREDKDDG